MVNDLNKEANSALTAYKSKAPFKLDLISTGLINKTFKVESASGVYILQKLHPVFQPQVNEDMEAVTLELKKQKMLTPLLVKTDENKLWTIVNGHCWRLQTFLAGQGFDKVQDEQMAFEAGRLVGKFHLALKDFTYEYRFKRTQVHDTRHFMSKLEKLAQENKQHKNYGQFIRLAEKILAYKDKLPQFDHLPQGNAHGDLKISNVLFDDKKQGECLLDLDTLGKMHMPLEMGDAFRSWCNPHAEDSQKAEFDLALFQNALKGYVLSAKSILGKAEIKMFYDGIWVIPLELSIRFLVDVLEDQYWGWDEDRYASRAEHNLATAWGQWTLNQDIEKKEAKIRILIDGAFQ